MTMSKGRWTVRVPSYVSEQELKRDAKSAIVWDTVATFEDFTEAAGYAKQFRIALVLPEPVTQ